MSELLDTRRYRTEKLKEMIRRLHDGADPEALKEEFREILADVGTAELSAMETELMEEGLPQEEVQRMCDVHALLFRLLTRICARVGVLGGFPGNGRER